MRKTLKKDQQTTIFSMEELLNKLFSMKELLNKLSYKIIYMRKDYKRK